MRTYVILFACLCALGCASPLWADGGDTCPGPTITALPYADIGNTTNMNNDYTHCTFGLAKDEVYTLLLDHNCWVTASLCNNGMFDVIEARTGGACPGDSVVACNGNFCGERGQATFLAHGNQPYYLQVYGHCTEAGPCFYGPFELVVSEGVSPIDTCPGAQIPSLPFTDQGTLCGALYQYGSYHCIPIPRPSKDVIYRLNLPTCQKVTVSTCGSNNAVFVSALRGNPCPGIYPPVGCATQLPCAPGLPITTGTMFDAGANIDYTIVVSTNTDDPVDYTLNVTSTPLVAEENDQCPGKIITELSIVVPTYADFGYTSCAHYDGYPHCGGDSSPDVIYVYTPDRTSGGCQNVTVTTCGSDYDTRLEVRTSGLCPGTTLVGCNDNSDSCGIGSLQSSVTFFAIPEITYYFIVSGNGSAAGYYELHIALNNQDATAPNDACPGTTISALPFTDYGNTVCSIFEQDYPTCSLLSTPDVVYNYTPAACQDVTVSLCGSSYDTRLAVHRDGPCPGTTEVACNDDNFCAGVQTLQSTVTFQGLQGVTYYIFVGGYTPFDVGPFVINVSAVPCGAAAAVDSLVIHPSGNNILLNWAAQGTAIRYRIYRASIPEVPVSPATLLDSTVNRTYTDLGVLSTSAARYFYAVTAVTSGLTSNTDPMQLYPDPPGHKANQ